MKNRDTFCEQYATNSGLTRLEKDSVIAVCRVVRRIAKENSSLLSYTEHEEFNKKVEPVLIRLIKGEI